MSEMSQAINKIWSELDKDSSGYLDRSEASVLIKKVFEVLNMPHDAQIETKIFNLIDKNNDGKISKEELTEALQ